MPDQEVVKLEGMTLEKLQVIIEAYTKPYRDELEKVKKQTTSTTSHVERQTSKMASSFRKIAGVVVAALSITALIAFGKSCIQLGSDLAEVQNVVDVTFGSMSKQVDAFSKNAITQFGLSELTAKKYMGTYGAMAKSFGVTGEAGYQMSAAITGLTGDVASFYNLSTDEAYTKLKSIFTGETESLKELGVVMTQTALDQYALNNGFGKTTAKMTEQEKVMLRYRFVMSSLSDASGDFARTSKSWANQVRVLQLQFQSLKATIGQGLINAFTPVIQVINTVLAKLQTLASYFKAFTVALFGDAGGSSDALSDAAGSSGTVADNLSDAADSAKKLKDYSLGIDELNVLNAEDSSGSGSGTGSDSSLDFGDLTKDWTEALVPDASELINKICQAFKNGDYQLAGVYIGEGITNALNSIDWLSIYFATGEFGQGLAEFLNGLISPELFGAVGKTIAGALNTALYAALSFGETFDWSNFGRSIASGVNNFFSTYDFAATGRAMSTFVLGLLDTLTVAVENTDWGKIGSQIGTFLNNLDWKTILAKTGKLIVDGLLAAIVTYMNSASTAPVETAIVTYLVLAVGSISPAVIVKALWKKITAAVTAVFAGGISIPSLAMTFGTFVLSNGSTPAIQVIGSEIIEIVEAFIREKFGQRVLDAMGESLWIVSGTALGLSLGGPIGAVVGFILGAITKEMMKWEPGTFWENFTNKLFNFDYASKLFNDADNFFRKAFSSDNFLEIGGNIIAGIGAGITGAFALLLEPIGDLFDWVWESVCNIFGIHSPAETMKPIGMNILLGIVEGFRNTFEEWTKSLDEWYTNYIAPWFTAQKWSDLYTTIKDELKSTWDNAVDVWKTDVNSWWNKNVSPWFTIQKWSDLYESVKTQLKQKWGETSEEWRNNLTDWWSIDVSPWFTVQKWLSLYDSVKSGLKSKWSDTVGVWKADLSSWWTNDVESWFTLERWKDAMKKIPDAFRDIFKNAVRTAIEVLNSFIDIVNDIFTFDWHWENPVTGAEYDSSVTLFQIPKINIPALADGGVLNSGQLFVANEAGPELVGKYGSKSGVVNNDQIVDAVSEGVAVAVANVMTAFQDSGSSDSSDINLIVDGRTLATVQTNTQKRSGFSLRRTRTV